MKKQLIEYLKSKGVKDLKDITYAFDNFIKGNSLKGKIFTTNNEKIKCYIKKEPYSHWILNIKLNEI